MPSPLSTLAVEIIETIADTLDRTDLCAVRLTCKDLNRKTFHHFGRTCFTSVQTDLSHSSMQKLQSISQTEQLKHLVQKFTINERNDNLGRGFHWHRAKGCDLTHHVDTQLSPGFQMLRDVLTNLVNCRSFKVRSLGGTEEHYESEYLLPSDAIGIILSIIAEIGLPVKSFHIAYGSRGSVDAKRLQLELCQQPVFIAAWEKIEELRLEHYLTSDNLDWAQDLVLHTMRLKKLSLHFGYDYSTSFIESILSSPIILQGLQELKLGCIHVTGDMLSTLLVHCRSSLRKLSLWHIYIKFGTWVQILTELRTFHLLESVSVEWPTEYRNEDIFRLQFPALENDPVVPGSDGRKFELKYKKWKGKKRVWGATFHGRVGMDKALEILAESVEDD